MKQNKFNPEENEFIKLSSGREYIRKFEIVGLRWEPRYDDLYLEDATVFHEKKWQLKVFLTDCPFMIVYDEDARAVMKALELPGEPPR